jgi:hypothetical protein
MSDIAYNAGLEIRYAIAASGVDPIQHIPEVDAIIERRLAEARRQAFIEAAEIAEEYDDQPKGLRVSEHIALIIRARAEEMQP